MQHTLNRYTRRDLGQALASAILEGNTQRAAMVRAEIIRRVGDSS